MHSPQLLIACSALGFATNKENPLQMSKVPLGGTTSTESHSLAPSASPGPGKQG